MSCTVSIKMQCAILDENITWISSEALPQPLQQPALLTSPCVRLLWLQLILVLNIFGLLNYSLSFTSFIVEAMYSILKADAIFAIWMKTATKRLLLYKLDETNKK